MDFGKWMLGLEASKRDAGHCWKIVDTQRRVPARCDLAQSLWDLGQRDAAITQYQNCLALFLGDPGIPELLAARLLELGRDRELNKLLDRYHESTAQSSAQWRYVQALADFRRAGDTPKARERLEQAVKANRHVPDFLLGRRELPLNEPSSFYVGSEDEAACCVGVIGNGWRATLGAMEWLEEIAPKKVKKGQMDAEPR